jgi:hypothetical protein
MTHEVVDGDSSYQCALAPDVELVGKFETGFIAVRYENGAVMFVPKRMVKKQAAMLPEPAETYASTITDEQKNKARLLIEQYEADTGETHHGGVFFSDKGEVILISKPLADAEKSNGGDAKSGKCVYPPCDLPIATGVCPKHGGAKQACSQEHYDLAEALGKTTSKESTTAEHEPPTKIDTTNAGGQKPSGRKIVVLMCRAMIALAQDDALWRLPLADTSDKESTAVGRLVDIRDGTEITTEQLGMTANGDMIHVVTIDAPHTAVQLKGDTK